MYRTFDLPAEQFFFSWLSMTEWCIIQALRTIYGARIFCELFTSKDFIYFIIVYSRIVVYKKLLVRRKSHNPINKIDNTIYYGNGIKYSRYCFIQR